MKYYKLLAIITAICAAVAIVAVIFALQQKTAADQQAAAMQSNPVTVYVAAKTIAPNTKITEEMLLKTTLPQAAVADGAIQSADEIVDKIATVTIDQNQQFTKSMFLSNVEADRLSYALGDDMKAITITINEESGLAQMIRQNDRLSMITSISQGEDGNGNNVVVSKYLIKNIRVIAVGRSLSPYKATGEYSTITLEVTEDVALLIDAAEKSGNIRFIMNQASDSTIDENANGPEVQKLDDSGTAVVETTNTAPEKLESARKAAEHANENANANMG